MNPKFVFTFCIRWEDTDKFTCLHAIRPVIWVGQDIYFEVLSDLNRIIQNKTGFIPYRHYFKFNPKKQFKTLEVIYIYFKNIIIICASGLLNGNSTLTIERKFSHIPHVPSIREIGPRTSLTCYHKQYVWVIKYINVYSTTARMYTHTQYFID